MSGPGFTVDDDKYKNVDFEDALEFTGFGKYNLALIVVCGLVLFGVNTESYAVGYVLPSAECELHLDTYTKGILTSSNFVGIMGTCCFWGYLSDTKGRKFVLMVCLMLATLCSIIAVFTPSFWGFTILRFCNGIFLAGPSAIIFAYFGEFQSRSHRSSAMAWTSLFVAFGLVALPALAWLLLPLNLSSPLNSWRLLMLLVSIPNLLAFLAFIKLPESPKYLYHSGKVTRALTVLKHIYATNNSKPESHFPAMSLQEKVLLADVDNKSVVRGFLKQIVPLFMPPHLKFTLASGLMQMGVFAVSGGLFIWYPDIINQLSYSTKNGSLTVCQSLEDMKTKQEDMSSCLERQVDDQVFIQNIVIGVAYVFSYVAWGFVVKCLGNRNFFGVCMVISAACLILLNFTTQKCLIDLLFVLLLTLPGICVAVINIMTVEVMPTHLCGMAICVIMTAGRVGSIFSSSVVGIMLKWQCEVTFSLYAASLLGCVLLVFVFPKHAN